MSGAMIFIQEDLKINDLQVGILAGILNLCALVGSLAAGRTSDYIGRRYTIFLSSIIFLVGAILMGYGPNYAVLMTGRCTAGVGVGFALMIAPLYAAEISSPTSRGRLTSLPELWHQYWTPTWLCVKLPFWETHFETWLENDAWDCWSPINWFGYWGSQNAGVPRCRGEEVWKELFLRPSPAVRRILLAAIGIHFFEHATGIESVILFSPRIFKKAGVTSRDMLLLATVGIGVTKTVFILLATFLIDKVGRRKLLLTSTLGMVISLAGLGFGLTMVENSKKELAWALSFSMVAGYVYVALFCIGLGPITWVYSTEIFPLKLRAQGTSVGVAVNRVVNAAVSMSFISIYKAITIGGAFFMFAGISVLAWVFFFLCLPETKGRSLEEMEMLFSKYRTTSSDHSRNDSGMRSTCDA
ncbi:hypothetical protein M0R45_004212 [Rubus argutus]|uniref:Major facilitator superfamily (MFS) profile domain-containing protein n=1 Tax=Rubus argutus TaxID=59490 RepID=A0AAW1YJ39_RUBAR